MSKGPLLRPEEVASVLALDTQQPGVGAAPGAVDEPAIRPYSLRRPVAIAADREADARRRLELIGAALQDALERELEATLKIEVHGFLQEQAGPALDAITSPAWVLAFSMAEGGGVALALDPACALSLVELALGGAGNSAEQVRGPTPLESRVLTSLCAAVTANLARGTDLAIARGEFFTSALPTSLAMRGETIAISPVKVFIGNHERGGLLVATPALLHEPEERESHAHATRVGPLAIAAGRAAIAARPVLRAGRVALSDLVGLESGQLLSLDAPEHSALELRLNGETIFAGRIEREGGAARFRIGWRRGRRPTVAAKEKK